VLYFGIQKSLAVKAVREYIISTFTYPIVAMLIIVVQEIVEFGVKAKLPPGRWPSSGIAPGPDGPLRILNTSSHGLCHNRFFAFSGTADLMPIASCMAPIKSAHDCRIRPQNFLSQTHNPFLISSRNT
jgi:hypothetical protein